MNATATKKRTVKKFLAAAIAALDDKYELVYVSQGDQLTDQQVAALVENNHEKLWDLTAEFEMENRDNGIDAAIESAVNQVVSDWERQDGEDYSDLRDRFMDSEHLESLREAISERDEGDWPRELASATPDVLLRINVLDEDDAYSHEPVEAAEALTRVGLPVNDSNLRIMRETLANASPEFSSLMAYWIVGADVEAIYLMPSDTTDVLITNPHLFFGNPLAGSGFISEEPFEGVVKVAREDLRTDQAAFGYGVDSLYGGLNASSFSATLTPLKRTVIGPDEVAPLTVAAFAGDGDVEVAVAFAGANGQPIVHITTEDNAKFQIIINGRVVPIAAPATAPEGESDHA